eukprot:498391-Amphidinium_carterae.2
MSPARYRRGQLLKRRSNWYRVQIAESTAFLVNSVWREFCSNGTIQCPNLQEYFWAGPFSEHRRGATWDFRVPSQRQKYIPQKLPGGIIFVRCNALPYLK